MKTIFYYFFAAVLWLGHAAFVSADEQLDIQVTLDTLPGIWQLEGYDNTVFALDSQSASVYQTSSVHCLLVDVIPLPTLSQVIPYVLTNEARDRWTRDPILYAEQVHTYPFNKISALPEACQHGITHYGLDPIDIFSTFWHTINENHAHLQRRNVDWQQQYDINLPKVSALSASAEDQPELFNILGSMIKSINDDAHSAIILADPNAPDGEVRINGLSFKDLGVRLRDALFDQYTQQELQDLFNAQTAIDDFDDFVESLVRGQLYSDRKLEHYSIIASYMTETPLAATANNRIRWGKMAGNIGYIEISAMDGFSTSADAASNMAALASALDTIMTQLANTDAMVVDLRLNNGGLEAAAVEVASRFFDRERKAYEKETREGDGFVNPQKIKISPAANPYIKPIYVLTSNVSISSPEYLTMALKALPYTTHIGENTNGVLSDNPPRVLPNGWTFSLSNDIISDSNGVVYEQVGVPPEHTALLFDDSFRTQQLDSALEQVNLLVSIQPQAVCEYKLKHQFPLGFVSKVRVTNTSSTNINGWQVQWQYGNGTAISLLKNAVLTSTVPYTAKNIFRNKRIKPGKSRSFKILGTHSGSVAPFTITGGICH